MRAHRRALAIGAVVLALGATLVTGVVTIATGRTGHESAVFARTAKLTVARGAVGKGLTLDGTSLVTRRASSRQPLATLGGGDEIIAPLTGSLTPVAAASSDRSFVVYSSWRQLARIQPDATGQGLETGQPVGVPSIRLFDLRRGKDTLIANGAASPAVSTSGAIAFLAGDSMTVRQNVDYVGRIVVADSPTSKPRVWTSMPARYLPYAWARRFLLVHRGVQDSEGADLYAYAGPDEGRLLAPDAYAIAVSPDGTKVLAAAGVRTLEVIRVADAAIEDTLLARHCVRTFRAAGADVRRKLARRQGRSQLRSRARGSQYTRRAARRVGVRDARLSARNRRAVFTDDTSVEGWADVGKLRGTPGGTGEPAYDNALVDCDLVTQSCVVDQANPARKWTRWVTNPSR
jgi:hypothetical protein